QLLRLPLAVFDSRCVAGLVMRVTQIDQIQQAITESLVALVTDTVLFVAALGIIFLYDHLAAAITLGAVPLIVGVTVLLDDRVAGSQLTWLVRLEEFGSHMVDTFESLRTVKTFSAEERYLRLLMARFERLAEARRANRVALAHPVAWSMLASSAITMGILWYGGNELLQGRLTAGELLVLFGMVSFCLGPVQRFPATALSARTALVAVERLEEIRTLPRERDRVANPLPLPRARGQVTFDQVSFGYRRHRPILSDVSFTIEPGETIAIVGETGSGKTSLANLIAGFYLPTFGDVRIDGISTRDLDPDELRRSVSAVFQDPKLLQQSVRDNITLLVDTPLDDVREAARRANADDFISRLINGYDSQVARGGDNFSSGQSQRIALARAFLKEAPIRILDEATSNLDGETEHAILQALEANRRQRTTIVIAHRLSTVLGADRVFVLDQGRLVETGTHQELLRRRGRYYELFHWQLVEASATGY
ncbi:MAG TPA: ABC transporter ATP-binding protein, partial [Chloroflexota bacterium]|nr:ABC transporter ATP-binding protein [Chloroflexota bacterium]